MLYGVCFRRLFVSLFDFMCCVGCVCVFVCCVCFSRCLVCFCLFVFGCFGCCVVLVLCLMLFEFVVSG